MFEVALLGELRSSVRSQSAAAIVFSFPFPSLLSSPLEPNLGRLEGKTFPLWSNWTT